MEDDRSQDGPLHVVCMVGPGRSGSTVLAELLATASGGVFLGELLHLGGRTETRSCSCGTRLVECPYWNGVSAECGLPLPELGRRFAAAKLATRTRPVPYLRAYFGGPDEELTALLRRVLAATCRVAGTRVAIESSKAPALLPALRGAADRASAVLVQRAADQVRRSYQKAREFSIRAGRDGYYRRTPPWSVPALVGAKSALSIAMARRLSVELETVAPAGRARRSQGPCRRDPAAVRTAARPCGPDPARRLPQGRPALRRREQQTPQAGLRPVRGVARRPCTPIPPHAAERNAT